MGLNHFVTVVSAVDKCLVLIEQVLGDGELVKPLTIKAASFSDGALEKIQAVGGVIDKVTLKPKWTRKLHKQMVADGTWEAKRRAKIERKKEKKAAGIL